MEHFEETTPLIMPGGIEAKKSDEYTQTPEDDLYLLSRAITSFNVTSRKLEHSYSELQKQIRNLNRDIAEKNRQLELNLREKEEVKNFLFNILESIPTGVIVTDAGGKVLIVNKALEKIAGVCPSEMKYLLHQQWLEQFFSPRGPGVYSDEIEYCRGDGETKHLQVMVSPVRAKDGKQIGRVIILQDQTTLKKLEIQAERDQSLKAMGKMAINLSHEIRNPLGSIELFASLLRRELSAKKDLKKMAEHIVTEVKRLNNLISNLLLFTKPQKPVFRQLDIISLIEEFIEFIKPVVINNGVQMLYSPCGMRFIISADKDLLKQVFLNIVLNAVQAMPDGGILEVKTRLVQEEDGQNGQWIAITFRDEGVGIKKEDLHNIFHPFYTRKDKGTGLGLAIAHNIVGCHGGIIEVKSLPGRGSSFILSFPVLKVIEHNQCVMYKQEQIFSEKN